MVSVLLLRVDEYGGFPCGIWEKCFCNVVVVRGLGVCGLICGLKGGKQRCWMTYTKSNTHTSSGDIDWRAYRDRNGLSEKQSKIAQKIEGRAQRISHLQRELDKIKVCVCFVCIMHMLIVFIHNPHILCPCIPFPMETPTHIPHRHTYTYISYIPPPSHTHLPPPPPPPLPQTQSKHAALEDLTPGQLDMLVRHGQDIDRLTIEIEDMEEGLCDSIRDAMRNKQQQQEGGGTGGKRAGGGGKGRSRKRGSDDDDDAGGWDDAGMQVYLFVCICCPSYWWVWFALPYSCCVRTHLLFHPPTFPTPIQHYLVCTHAHHAPMRTHPCAPTPFTHQGRVMMTRFMTGVNRAPLAD